ncbi:hypothetical protein FN846DRAFT_412750 [Sphaerosporella brunnea]|uniref:Zn(2)-C6 fungal-type domain-containing protein n=1 Tax=Sphaerosporella brunnea TaxID=1250544 RepID=A0A5J5F587_9PEZI|nr:hypothetical protein FN846DRAFT_412750 [Sphaerosporella brunnea]
MSEESPYGAHPVAAPNHYAQVSQPHGGVYRPGVAPAHHPYVYREQGGPGYNMNGIAGGSHAFRAPMPATPRGSPPTPAQAQWQSSYYQTPVSQEAVQPAHAPASYPPPEPQGPWNKTPNTSFARPQASSQGQSFSNTHNYNHYSRPHHNPMEPSAAPSPPNLYPSSPRTPVSAHQTVGSSSIPQPPPFRQPNPRPLTPSSAMSLGVPTENAAHRPEPPSRFVESPSTTHSLMTRNPVRGHMASPLGPPVSVNGTQRGSSFNNTHRNSESYVSQLSSVDNEGGERPASAPKTMRFHGSQSEYDSADDEKPKRIKREPDSPSTALSPTTIRIDICPDSDRSPSFPGPVNKPNGLEMSGKKKGSPVFRDAKGNEYYENEPVPPGVIVPEGWQLGTGKLTKGLLLPCAKDGIAVNPEWGFTAGGKARQRLPQACRNCRAKKIRCVESDYDETVCQHCSKMRITCQRYEK